MDSSQIVFADIDSLTVNIPKQAGAQIGTDHYFWGSGNIVMSDSVIINIAYCDSLSGVVSTGNIRYTKP
jgi:hypothetical protein